MQPSQLNLDLLFHHPIHFLFAKQVIAAVLVAMILKMQIWFILFLRYSFFSLSLWCERGKWMQIVHFASVPNYLFTQRHFLFNSIRLDDFFYKRIKLKNEISKYDVCVWRRETIHRDLVHETWSFPQLFLLLLLLKLTRMGCFIFCFFKFLNHKFILRNLKLPIL